MTTIRCAAISGSKSATIGDGSRPMRGTYLAKAARAIAPIHAASSAVALRISGVLLSVVICFRICRQGQYGSTEPFFILRPTCHSQRLLGRADEVIADPHLIDLLMASR